MIWLKLLRLRSQLLGLLLIFTFVPLFIAVAAGLNKHAGFDRSVAGILGFFFAGLIVMNVAVVTLMLWGQFLRTRPGLALLRRRWPRSLGDGRRRAFVPESGAALAAPQASIYFDSAQRDLRIASHDLGKDILLPLSLVAQIEFDPGDDAKCFGNLMPWERQAWSPALHLPTIFLGIPCGRKSEIFVYPLGFSPNDRKDAEAWFHSLCEAHAAITERHSFRLGSGMLRFLLPKPLPTGALPEDALKKFWPDYMRPHDAQKHAVVVKF